jgi:CheY-like chemotaxis protein
MKFSSGYLTSNLRNAYRLTNRRFQAVKKYATRRNDATPREISPHFGTEKRPLIPLRILIAEDDLLLNNVLCLVLDEYGYSVKSVSNGQSAFDLVRDDLDGFDLIITDHAMPGLNGLGLVRCLRTISYPGKIIVLASPPDPEDQKAYRELLVDRLLFKPVETRLLIQAIKEVALQR